jgi:hypothetical protein
VNANEGEFNEGRWGDLLPDFMQLILILLLFLLEAAEDVRLSHCLQVSRAKILHHFKAFLHDVRREGSLVLTRHSRNHFCRRLKYFDMVT